MTDEFQIIIHGRERILEVRYPPRPDLNEYLDYDVKVRRAIEAWHGEWDCLVDQSRLTVMPPALAPKISELNAWARQKGMRRTARVVRDSAMAELQVNRILRESGAAAMAALFRTREEAWQWLTRPAGSNER